MSDSLVRIRPLEFVHILDQNKNFPILEVGPKTRVIQTHERLLGGPFPFVVVPRGFYCIVRDPCINYEHGKPGQLKHGEFDVRLHKMPFPLYPGESLVGAETFGYTSVDYSSALKKLPVILPNHGLRLMARVDHMDGGIQRRASEEWQVEGPCTYIPTPEREILRIVTPFILRPRQALRLRATQDCKDKAGRERVTGEEWLVTKEGAYLPGVFEELMGEEEAVTITPDTAVHLRSVCTLTDSFNNERQAGEEWMVTSADTELLFPQIGVEVLQTVSRIVLRKNQFCVVVDPVDDEGRPQLGNFEVRQGVCSFFLHPGETLAAGIQDAYMLGADEAVVLQAQKQFEDDSGKDVKVRKSGERWMIVGPCVYVPHIDVRVLTKRKTTPLAKNEGIYVRHTKTGQVRAVMGPVAYMLTAYEELWSKPLSEEVEQMLQKGGGLGSGNIRKIAYFEQSIDPTTQKKGRNKTRVITYRCPHNTACQVYDHMRKQARIVFGPDLVVLGPHEDFNVLSLSAGKPKKTDALKSIALMLGPDFITDILQVETLDHARLQIQLAFNNYFEVDKSDPDAANIFSVPDFIGFACRQIGSRIRGTVAQITFDEFHRHSSRVIQTAVFGLDEKNQLRKTLQFPANNLVVTGVDVQSIEPVDKKMRDSLTQSVQMAIEIATSSIERSARHEAECLEQVSRGELEHAKLLFEKKAEKERTKLVELRAITAAVESTGQAVAEAQAKRESMIIEGQSEIEVERMKAKAAMIEHKVKLSMQQKAQAQDLAHSKAMNELEIEKLQEITNIEVRKFTAQVRSLGVATVSSIATAGPTLQASMLEGLGLESTLLTDGRTPVNLFDTINGLMPVK